MTENQDQCCGDPAVVMVAWPGRNPIAMCGHHGARAAQIAQKMGFYLPTIPLGIGYTCASKDPKPAEPGSTPEAT